MPTHPSIHLASWFDPCSSPFSQFFSPTAISFGFFCFALGISNILTLSTSSSYILRHILCPNNLAFMLIQLSFVDFISMAAKGSSSTPLRVILMLSAYKEYLHLTQAAKSASISSVAQTGNASACRSHSSGPWILDFGASDHLSGKKNLFSSLTITSSLPMITLANDSQPWLKESVRHVLFLPYPLLLSFMFLNLLFNLISISKVDP